MIAMNYLDRVLSRSDLLSYSKQEVQLLALTCFYLTVKLFQAGPILSTQQISMISGGTYSAKQVAAMEQRMLFILDWCLHPPCAADFLRPYFTILLCHKSVPSDLYSFEVVDLALGMLSAATLDYFFVAYQLPPSHLAAAALLNAMRSILPISNSLPTVHDITRVLTQYTGCPLNEGQVNICCERLWDILEASGHGHWSPTAATPSSHRSPTPGCDSSAPIGLPNDRMCSPVGVTTVAVPSQNPIFMLLSMLPTVPYHQGAFMHEGHSAASRRP
jgi:Cyclin, N-terminal domain/Cyclin, C-terminal domain